MSEILTNIQIKRFMYRIIISIAAVFLMLSCNMISSHEEDGRITLSAVVKDMGGVESKTADPFEGITTTKSLNAKVLFSFNAGVYINAAEYPWYIPSHTDVTYSGSGLTFIKYDGKDVIYPTSTDIASGHTGTVYCTGLYPNAGWMFDDNGTSASHSIDGSVDIMFADQISGTWADPFTVQEYSHLQTWIRVLASANTIDAGAQWGKIQKVTIKSSASIVITFPKENATSTVTYSDTSTDIIVYDKETDIENPEGRSLSITTSPLGEVFVSPQATLTVTVYTSTFPKGKTVEIKLHDISNKEIPESAISEKVTGHLFVLNLNFNPLSIIEGTCTLQYWNDQDEDIYLE